MRPAAPNSGSVFERVLITGGCGFLGCNIADRLAKEGRHVILFDNMARDGAEENAQWLKRRHPGRVAVEVADVRHYDAVCSAVRECTAVLHLAAQVAVTTSVEDPFADFEVNARGTLNLLEALHRHNPLAPMIFASTNKVYGKLLEDDAVTRKGDRYVPLNAALLGGISEATPIDFYSPYGCSKGAADQYVRDYARVFSLRTLVLRMSCIYGPRQFGTEDQGWVAHFMRRAIRAQPITLYGSGFQVRDVLFVDDAVDAWIRGLERIDAVSGSIFNLGGGDANAVSLLEMTRLMAAQLGSKLEWCFAKERPGDQPWYVSDISAIASALDWTPRTALPEGLQQLECWLESRFGHLAATAA